MKMVFFISKAFRYVRLNIRGSEYVATAPCHLAEWRLCGGQQRTDNSPSSDPSRGERTGGDWGAG